MGRPKNGKNKQRTCEEKAALIEEYYNSGIGYRVFAEDHKISPSLFYAWIQKYEEGGIEGLRFKRKHPPKTDALSKEILRLKLIIAEQQIEIQNLKELSHKKG